MGHRSRRSMIPLAIQRLAVHKGLTGMSRARHGWMFATTVALLVGLMGCASAAFASDAASPRDGLPPDVAVPAWAVGKSIHFYPTTAAATVAASISPLIAPATTLGPIGGGAALQGRPDEPRAQPSRAESDSVAPSVKASASRLEYHGGPVQLQPRLVAIFWGTNWESEPGAELKRRLEKMFDGLAGSAWQKILTQYGDALDPAQISGSPIIDVYDDRRVSAPTQVEFWKIEGEAEEVMASDDANGTPDTTYMVMPAPGTEYTEYFDTGFCGWHAAMADGRALAFVPYEGQPPFESGCGVAIAGPEIPTSIAASHEYAESVTDPEPDTGWEESKNRQELADLCNEPWQMADGAWVTGLWDDSRDECAGEDSDPGTVTIGPNLYPEDEKASEITQTSVTLEGSVAPCGEEAHYYFEYGTTSAFGMRSQVGVTPAGRWEYVPYRASLEGLQAGTEYHWRLVAETSDGVAMGSEGFFSTKPYLALYVESAEDIGTTETKLNGDINPEGEEATYYFEYGTTEAYGSRTAEVSAGAGTREVEVSAPIGGLPPTTTYHFRLVAKDGHGTFYTHDKEFVTGGEPPVETGAATEIGAFGVTLSGTVGPDQGDTHYYFEYGLTEAYGSSSPEGSEVLRIPDVMPINQTLTGLAANTLYHYRIVAINEFGTSHGSDRVFTTEIAPSAQTEDATHVTANSATLSGSVDPNGVKTTYQFEYHTGSENSASTPVEVAGSGTEDLKESADLSGLASDTTYRYRLVATNEFAVVDGEEKTFATASVAPAEPEPEAKANPRGGTVSPGPTPTLVSPATTGPAGLLPISIVPAPAVGDLSLAKVQRGGAVALGLTIAAAGSSVEIVAALNHPARGRAHRRTLVVLGRARRADVPTGRLTLKVALDRRGMRELRRRRHLTVTVTVLVHAPGGTSSTIARTVMLEL